MDPMVTSKDNDNILERSTTDLPTTITHTEPKFEYLYYSPMSTTSSTFFKQCNYFDLLGFKPAGGVPDMRDCLATDMNLYVKSKHDMFLDKASTEDALKVAVSEFLAEYGPKYWGVDKRDHLQEPDIYKGFLCPRDAQREDSRLIRLIDVVSRYFKFKRRQTLVTLKKMKKRQIEEAAISENPQKSRKRSTAHSESKDAEEGEVSLCEPSGASKRYRPLHTACAMSMPSLLDSEGLNQQSRQPIPSPMRIASIHRPADVIASDKSDKKTKPADLSTSSHTARLTHEAAKPLTGATSSSLATWTKYSVPPTSAIVPSQRIGLPYEATKLLPGATSSSSATWTKYPVPPTSAIVPSQSVGLPHEVTKLLPGATSSSSATWTKYPVPPTSAIVPSQSVGLPHEVTKLLPRAKSSSSAMWTNYPVPAPSPPSAIVPFHPASPSEVTSSTTAFGLHGPTTPLTPISNPKRYHGEIIDLSDDCNDWEEQWSRKSITTSTNTSTKNDKASVAGTAPSIVEVKNEPLTGFMMVNTMFLVTVHDSPLGPVPVPFTECRDFHILFATLIEERGVPDDDARKIDNITTTFAWTGGEFGGKIGGIRRHKPRDWEYFCETLRKAHEMDFDRFKGKCEVAMKLHINAAV